MKDDRQMLIVIGGPTASGKSSLAVELARHFDGEILNADSMQVYRDMDVGTAKPSIAERKGIPHHLLDVVDPDEDFNAAIYRALAVPCLKKIASKEKLCFVVGGTGLYIKTLLGGLIDCPPPVQALRLELHQEWDKHGSDVLYERLRLLDPESALKIHPHDKIRVVRALEIIHLTHERPSSLMRRHGFRNSPFRALKICLQMDRKHLYHRIDERCRVMIEHGLVGETERLLRKGYSPDLKPMMSLGYRHMVKYLEGSWDLDESLRRLRADTRRYAKRQLTWFRADPEVIWMVPERIDNIIKTIDEFIGSEYLAINRGKK
jgi:tRNA dimethylallyltransferase